MAFHGAFVVRKQDHGILTITYFNNGNDFIPYPETAKLKEENNKSVDPFIGIYETLWLEKGIHHIGDLEIIPHPPKNVYKLTWTSKAKRKDFEGYGMLENGTLVGFYY